MTPRRTAILLAAASAFAMQAHVQAQAQAQANTRSASHAGGAKAPAAVAGADDLFRLSVRADQRALDPVLLVRQEPVRAAGGYGFLSYSNYRAFIVRQEVRIFRRGDDPAEASPLAVVEVDAQGMARWEPPVAPEEGTGFVLRAYGANGHWDETRLHPLQPAGWNGAEAARTGTIPFGQRDEAIRRTIMLRGISRTVQGVADARSQTVRVDGMAVPVAANGIFVSEQIIPDRNGVVRIEIRDQDRPVLIAERHYDASSRRWFVVGQGDLTFSHAVANGPATAVSGDPLASGDHLMSRGAFYAKGVVGHDYRVTASVDTGETLLKDLFSNLDRKDPSQLLRRIDDSYHYPTYGDGSTIIEDAPSQGRFYLRVQKDDSNLVVGNFITAARGTELVQLDRGLFGAMLDYRGGAYTGFGERKRQLMLFASDPGTITAADELRGTGGSLYYLHHQDISVGSERLRLEVRAPTTGAVLTSTPLRIGEDYEIDYFQGRITLLRPLASYVPNDALVRDAAQSGNAPVLVARYEYTPTAGSITGHSLGGRASQWIGNILRLGVTGQSETAAPADQMVLGGDIMLRAAANSWLKAEYGRSDGPGFAHASSLDGGLNYSDIGSAAVAGQIAHAYRIEGALDEADLFPAARGKATAFFESYEAGYAAMGRPSANAMHRWGSKLEQKLGRHSQLALAFDGRVDDGQGSTRLARGEWTQQLNPALSLRSGVRYEDVELPSSPLSAQGERLDGGVQLAYGRIGSAWSAYGFGQATLAHDAARRANDRGGVGVKWQMTPALSLSGEVSDGTGGWAANAQLNRRRSNGSESHIGYRLYSDVTDRGYDPQELLTSASRGMLVIGARQPLSDTLTLSGEEKYGHGGPAPSLAHSYGLRFAPDKMWSFAAGIESSHVRDTRPASVGEIDRLAATLSASHVRESWQVSSAVEFRRDRAMGGSQTSWLFRDKADYKPSASWHLLGRFEYAFTDVGGTSLQAANYTRAVAGIGYRPVDFNRLNLLLRYTYLRDLGPAGQIMANGGVEQPRQVSQVFSADLSYDLTDWLTLGGKYARRQGRVSLARASDVYVNSAACLYAVRGDVHFTRKWDMLVEGRLLTASLAHDRRAGILAAAYRKLGSGIKLGAGYNFTDYSGDLTDQSYSTRGMFINLLAAF